MTAERLRFESDYPEDPRTPLGRVIEMVWAISAVFGFVAMLGAAVPAFVAALRERERSTDAVTPETIDRRALLLGPSSAERGVAA